MPYSTQFFSPTSAELAEQERRLREEVGQAGAGEGGVVAVDGAGGALHEVERDIEVVPQLLLRVQAPRDRRQGLQERRDGLAVGRLLHARDDGHDRRQRVLAQRLGGGRPFLQETPASARRRAPACR